MLFVKYKSNGGEIVAKVVQKHGIFFRHFWYWFGETISVYRVVLRVLIILYNYLSI